MLSEGYARWTLKNIDTFDWPKGQAKPFDIIREPLGGSFELLTAMTRERVWESHRVAFLMPKGQAFRIACTNFGS